MFKFLIADNEALAPKLVLAWSSSNLEQHQDQASIILAKLERVLSLKKTH